MWEREHVDFEIRDVTFEKSAEQQLIMELIEGKHEVAIDYGVDRSKATE